MKQKEIITPKTRSGQLLYRLRCERGYLYNRSAFLNRFGVDISDSTWKRWEYGKQIPRLVHLQYLVSIELLTVQSQGYKDLLSAMERGLEGPLSRTQRGAGGEFRLCP